MRLQTNSSTKALMVGAVIVSGVLLIFSSVQIRGISETYGFDTQRYTVQCELRTSSGNTRMDLYELEIDNPDTASLEKDISVQTTLDQLNDRLLKVDDRYSVSLELTSTSFEVAPKDVLTMPLKPGSSQSFSITPLREGERKLVLTSFLTGPRGWLVWPGDSLHVPTDPATKVIDILVERKGSLFGLKESTLRSLQIISSMVGLPGIILLIIQGIKSRRSKAKQSKSRIILPNELNN